MKALEDDYEQCLATVATMLTTEGMDEAASLLRSAKLRIVSLHEG